MDIDLSAEIEKLLEEQKELADEVLEKATQKVAKYTVKELKATSPKKTGKYANSWGRKETTQTGGSKQITIHNKKHYRLTHLIEFGYATVDGGRVEGRPHIEPVEQKAIKDFEDEIRKGIENG